jgi:phospholipid transport system substrate-binding protein
MLRRLALATALAIGAIAIAPAAFAQSAPADAASTAAPASQQSPEQIVQSIADQLANDIDGHRDELKHNQDKLINIIDEVFLPHFDVDYASILVLGQHAREATPEQRNRFSKAFYNSITHRYAQGLLDYTRGRVKVLPFNGDLNDKRTVVRTQVLMDDGKSVSIDYAFRKSRTGDWKAYDVIIEGISYVTNYRNQVDAEIRKVGIDQLIKNLETQGENALKSMEQDSKDGKGAQ